MEENKECGWAKDIETLQRQLPEIHKMYLDNGLRIVNTGSVCPEQYEVYKGDKWVADYHTRYGEFTVNCSKDGFDIILDTDSGFGCFYEDERIPQLKHAMEVLLKRLEDEK